MPSRLAPGQLAAAPGRGFAGTVSAQLLCLFVVYRPAEPLRWPQSTPNQRLREGARAITSATVAPRDSIPGTVTYKLWVYFTTKMSHYTLETSW